MEASKRAILLVEDDKSLGETLKERLEKEGLLVQWASTYTEARKLVQQVFDLAIIDIGLPDGDGWTLARELALSSKTPFLFLTAMNSPENRLEGYEIGAVDYIPKPFHLKEFLLRVRNALGVAAGTVPFKGAGFTIDLDALTIHFANGEREILSTRDYRVLRALVEAAPKVVSRSEILKIIWDRGPRPTERSIDNSIVRLRQQLREHGNMIRSVRGIGYQWFNSNEN